MPQRQPSYAHLEEQLWVSHDDVFGFGASCCHSEASSYPRPRRHGGCLGPMDFNDFCFPKSMGRALVRLSSKLLSDVVVLGLGVLASPSIRLGLHR